MEKIRIRGLAVSAAWIFLSWGILVAVNGLYDVIAGEPESNLYSQSKWEFVTKAQWFNWSGFEITYGLACVGMAYLVWKYSGFLPEYKER